MPTHDARTDDGLPQVSERFAAFLAAMGSAAGIRADADSLYLAKAFDYVSAREMRRPRARLSGALLCPVVYETPEWEESISYPIYDMVGMAKIISNYADDLPRADVVAGEMTVRIKTVGNSYGYNVDELEKAIAKRTGLDTLRARAARTADAEENNRIIMQGEPRYKMPGLVNHPNISLVVPTTGNWSAAATTGDQIVDDFDSLYNAIRVQSNGIHTPAVVGISPKAMSAVRTKRMGGAAQTRVINHVREAYEGVTLVESYELSAAGPGGSDVLFMGTNNADDYRFEGVQRFKELPPQARNLEVIVNCKSRTAGVVVSMPLALAIMPGV